MEQKVRHKASRANSRAGSQHGSRADSSMSSSIHQARFGSRSFIGSKSNLFSSSRQKLASESMRFQKPAAQITDEESGVDVTPQSLLLPEHLAVLCKNQSNMFGGGETSTPNDSVFQQSIYGTGLGATSFAQPFSRSMFSASMTDAGTTSLQSSISDEVGALPTTHTSKPVAPHEEHVDIVKEDHVLSEADLEKEADINLMETETIWILDIPSTCVALDSEEAQLVQKRNEEYQEMVKGRAGNDRYSERAMQTINFSAKVKQIQTDPVIKTDSGMTASSWDMYDTYEAIKEAQNAEAGKSEEETLEELSSRATSRMTSGASRHSRAPTSMGMATGDGNATTVVPGESSTFNASMMVSVAPGTATAAGVPSVMSMVNKHEDIDPSKPNDHPILKLESLKDSLRIAERAVIQNIYQPKQAMYRKEQVLKDPDRPTTSIDTVKIPTPHLEKLWTYICPLTKRRKVTCIAWNPTNKDLVAIGYGKFSTNEECVGLICCWSLKNPEYPERIFFAQSGVTSLSFSFKHPNLLAAGLFNGTVALYNVRSTSHESVLDSRDALHKHSGPVWQVKWVVRERSMGDDKNENLVSISVDGRVLQWSIRKGFESSQLMKLKRMITPKPVDKKVKTKHGSRVNPSAVVQPGGGEAYISQHAPGMGFDFSPRDSNIYLVCTEEGYIHKCSCSYNEQVLETYSGHTGPVNRVYWNTFATELFLSCSSDWSVRLWNQESSEPIQVFKGAQKTVNDICWSPSVSTMFGCVSEGRVEVWDLDHSTIDPLIVYKPHSVAVQTTITFAQDSEVVLVGDSDGEVNVYLLKNTPTPPDDQMGALLNAIKSSHKDLL